MRGYLSTRLLDRQIVDIHGVRCGKVDDVELTAERAMPVRIAALLVGPDAWARRLPRPVRRLVERSRISGLVRIPWEEVREVRTDEVQLKRPAPELGLGIGDEAVARRVAHLPMAD